MSILEQIQDAAISKDQAIADLLRRCKVLAVRLGSQELNHWVDRELNGYAPEDSLPDYRVAKVQSRASLVGLFGRQATNIPLPLSAVPKEFRYLVEEAQLNEPIGAYEDLLRTGGKEGVYQIPWPADLIRIISTTIYEAMNIVTAWQQIPRGMIVGLVDSVRNRVLGFALELEKIAPSSDEASAGKPAVSPEQVHQVFQTHIYGSVGNFAQGGSGASQSIRQMVTAGDFGSLSNHLARIGVSEEDIKELQTAVEKDKRHGEGFGKAVGGWVGKVLGKAGAGLLKVSVASASEIVPKLISRYLNLPD